jgi:BirA family biotin operon repressor/biotin-[acetyl-CoA-carboxylase] ligase
MEVAKKMISENPNLDNFMVISETQTIGKGRIQRKWFSPPGGIYFSLLIKPKISPQEVFLLNYLFSLSVVEVFKQHYSVEATTKWPNDVIVKNKKICGILIESDIEIDKVNWCIVGVGININIEKNFFVKHNLKATSLSEIIKRKVDLTEFLILLFEKINKWFDVFNKKTYNKLISEWKKNSSTIGKKVKVITFNETIKSIALDISPTTGALIIKTPTGTQEILSGDCFHLR